MSQSREATTRVNQALSLLTPAHQILPDCLCLGEQGQATWDAASTSNSTPPPPALHKWATGEHRTASRSPTRHLRIP